MKRTAPAFAYDNRTSSFRCIGTITCECVGEWSSGKRRIKSWMMVDNVNSWQFSLSRSNNKFYFVLESID